MMTPEDREIEAFRLMMLPSVEGIEVAQFAYKMAAIAVRQSIVEIRNLGMELTGDQILDILDHCADYWEEASEL